MPKIVKNSKGIAKPKNILKTIKRIIVYMFNFKIQLFIVFIGIIISSLARVVGTSFLKVVIDNYIEPLAKNYNIELLNRFIHTLFIVGLIYVIGVFCSYLYSRILMSISAGTLYKIRIDLFSKMEKLPLKYVDAIREMLSESLPSCVFSIISVIGIFSMMVYYSWQLTLIVIIMFSVMLLFVKKIAGKSGKYFKEQQDELGNVNGFIEEMIEGQKVETGFKS